MLGTKYIVKNGDCLWDIAGKQLGDPIRWQEIYDHNNTPEVTAVTKMRMADPDLIFIGQTLYIPNNGSNPVAPPSAKPIPRRNHDGKAKARAQIRSIPFKYDFGSLPQMTVVSPAYIATLRMSGSVTVQSEKPIDFVSVSSKGYEINAKREADLAFGKLATNVKVGFNPTSKQVTFECGMTSQANVAHAHVIGTALAISQTTKLPVIKTSVKFPPLKGKVSNHFFLSNNFTVAIEITPKPPKLQPRSLPSAKPVPAPAPQSRPSVWDYLIAGALVASAAVLVVATIAEDIITLGAGVADDVPSFAAAAGMFTIGMSTFKSVQGVAPVNVPIKEM